MTKATPGKLLLFTLIFFTLNSRLAAQCSQSDISPVSFQKIITTDVTCAQNGTITIPGVSGGGGQFVYEVFEGPLKRGVQTQNVFSALVAGKYKVRITGCNGQFAEASVVIANKYLEPPLPSLRFIKEQGLKCNSTNNGQAVLALSLDLPGSFADSSLYSLPFTYQITTVQKQVIQTGKVKTYTLHNSKLQSYEGNSNVLIKYDTLTALEAGKTYYVKVTDQCGAFKTASVEIPNIESAPVSYSFELKEPFVLPASDNNFRVKENCIQWGELGILSNGVNVSSIASSNTYAPLTVKIIRTDNNQIVAERKITWGNLYKSENRHAKNDNNLLFDSLPRVPLRIEVTNQCGNTTMLEGKMVKQEHAFLMKFRQECFENRPVIDIFTAGGIPSLPVQFFLYDNQNNLLSSKILKTNTTQSIYLKSEAPQPSEAITTIADHGEYLAVMEDACGRKESIKFDSKPLSIATVRPELSFISSRSVCGRDEQYTVFIKQQNDVQIKTIQLLTGPNGISNAATAKSKVTTLANGLEHTMFFFDSLKMGVYEITVAFGCGNTLTSSFSTETETNASIKGSLNFSVLSNQCTNKGNTVNGNAEVFSEDEQLPIVQKPQIRISQAPASFLAEIATLKNGMDFYLPIELGNYNAITTAGNGLEKGLETMAPRYSFQQLVNGVFRFPAGNYTFQLYNSCNGKILDSKSFTVEDADYTPPLIGAVAGLICDSGQARIIVNPSGGDGFFKYQIREVNPHRPSLYGPLQANSIFILPPKTPAGSIYQVRAEDGCGNSTVANVVVSTVADKLYVASNVKDLEEPARIITGFIPGATYTWLQPDGTATTSNANELYFEKFKSSDIGHYSVAINALEGCIKRTAGGEVGNTQLSVPFSGIKGFDATVNSNTLVQLHWELPTDTSITRFDIQKSSNGTDWSSIGQVTSSNFYLYMHNGKFEYPDIIKAASKEPVLYYRIKYLIKNAPSFTDVKKVYLINDFQVEKVYPTNFYNTIYIDFVSSSTDRVVLLLRDLSGKEVQRTILPVSEGINHVQLNAKSELSAGTYLLVVMQGKNKFVTQLVKTE